MNKPYNISTAVMVVMVSLFLLVTFEVSWAQTYKIMPLGDSITRGVTGSATPGGYRDDLKTLLTDEYVNSDFVGSQSDGSFSDPQHEGHEGATVDFINNNVTSWVSGASPDFVLLNIGTNDLGVIHIETIADGINSICDKIYGVDTGITIFLSSLLPREDNASKDSLVNQVNRLIKRIAVEKQDAGYNIYYVGLNELFKHNPDYATEYMFDGIHPNDTGYNQMAQLFWSAIMNVIKKEGSIIIDNFNRSVIGVAWEYDPAFTLETVSPSQRELRNASTENRWNMMAAYKAINNLGEVSIRWGQNATSLGIENGGLALRLNKASTSANGYLLRVKQDGSLNLWTIVNGNPSEDIAEESGIQPTAGQVFKVVLSSDAVAHHFHCYIDGSYVGTVSDFQRRRGNEAELYAGVMLRGSFDGSTTLENNIDNFDLHIIGDIKPPARISNLSVASTTGSSVTLTWTAPGDDSLSDQASYYDIRYSTSALTENNWDKAKQAPNIEKPAAPGATQSFVVMGLEGDKKYYLGIKTADEEYNWSMLSNVVDATTSGGAALQKADDFSDPSTLTQMWSANPSYVIQNGELANTSTANSWGHLAVFKVNVSPIEASLTWSPNATSDGIDKGALALMLDTDNYTTANGYLAWIRTQVGDDPVLYLFTQKAGTPDVFLGTFTASGLNKPGPGDVFKVAVSSDGTGHHFDYYVNEKFYGRLDDPGKTYSDGTDYYMGIELHGNLNNNVDRFVTVNTVGEPSILQKVKPLGTVTGIVGKPLSDSLIIKVTDKSGNPIAGLNVDFTVSQGGGSLDIQSSDNYVRIEAENANVIESPMEIAVDPSASNSQYIVPNGGDPMEGKAEFNFYAKEAGNYVVWCRMALPNTNILTLFVQVDDKPTISIGPDPGVWQFNSYEPGPWKWLVVTERPSNDVKTYNLSKGNHTLRITQRGASGTKIDKILLSNNFNYVPSGFEDVPQYITDALGQARAQFTLGTVAGENRVEAMVPGYTLTGAPAAFVINGNADTPVSMVASSPTTQTGAGGQKLAQPFEVTLKDKYGNAAANYDITFTVTQGDGFLTNGQTEHKVKSDINGKAATYLTLGTEFANNKVAASFGSLTPVNFTATATSGIANAMQYQGGNSQSAKVGTTLPNPLKVKIVDNQGQAVVNHNVKFQVSAGGGSLVPTSLGAGNENVGESMPSDDFLQLNGAPTMDVLTNNEGIASVRLVVGLVAGVNTVQATSNAGGAPLTPVEFNATAIPDIPDTLTAVSGNNQTGAAGMPVSKPFVVKVADQFDNPIYGHKVQFAVIAGDGFLNGKTDRTKSVLTDPEGKSQVFLTLGNVAGVSNQVTAESYIGEELIVNPGFEVAGTGGLDVFANWIVEPHGASTVSDETAQVHGGSHACRINVVSGTEYHTTLIQDVALNVNQEYELSWWGKISGQTEFAYFIQNKDTKHWWKESSQEWIESYAPNRVTMTTNYEKYSIKFTRESTGTNYQVQFRPIENSNHAIYLDDISLTLFFESGGGSLLGTTFPGNNQVRISNISSSTMLSGVTPLGGSPVTFSATAGFVTTIQPKSSTSNLVGSAGTALDDSIEVIVTDNYGNPVGGYPVKFSSTTGDNPGTFNGHTWHEIEVLTDSYGIARVAFYCGQKPGIASPAKAIADGLTGSPITFNVSVADLAKFEYVDGNNQTGTVGSVLPKPLQAKVVDQRGKPIPGFDVTFKIIQGGGKIAGDSVAVIKSDTTTKVAAAEFKLGPAPGTNNNIVEASAMYKGQPLTGSPIRYTASSIVGEPTELIEVSGNYQRTVVGSPLEKPIVVLVGDTFQNPYAGRPVTFTVKTGGGYLDGDSTKKTVTKNTDNTGKAQVNLTVGRTSGQNNNEVEIASFKSGTQTHLTNSPMTFYASGTHSPAHTLETVSGTGQPRSPVRQALAQPYVVKITDRDGNPVPDHPVQWEIPQGNGSFDGLTDSIKTVPTNTNGISQVYYYPGPVAGLQNIVRARSWNQVELNGSPRTFVIDTKEGSVSAKHSIVTATSPVPADGESKSTITVILQDDWGNKITNKVVGFLSVSGSNNIQSGFWNPADSNGQTEGYLASKKAEVKVITVRDITDGVNLEDSAKVRFTPLNAHSVGYVSGTDQTGNFGTVVRNPIKAIVVDINGNPIPSHPVLFEAYEGGGYIWEHQGLGAPFVYTDENGVASANWVMGPSAEVNRARVIAEGLVNSGSVRYIATAHEGTPQRIDRQSGNSQSGTAGLPLAGSFVVKVVDNYGDPIFNYPVKFKVEYGDGNFNGSSIVTLNTNPFGQASQLLTLGRLAGSNVASVDAPALLGSPIGFTSQGVAGDAAKIVKWAGEGKTGPVGGVISGIQAKVTDIFDNAVSGHTVNFAVNKGSANINGSGAVVTGPDGVASVSIVLGTTIGEIEIIAAAPGLIGDGLKIIVFAGASSAVSMEIYHGNEQSGTIERELVYPFSVRVLDQHGNPAGGQNVPVSFVRVKGNGMLLNGPTVYADENGIASAKFQLGNLAGASYSIWAINNNLSGSPVEFTASGVINKYPIFAPIPDATVRENQKISFTVNATDDDQDPVRYGIRNLPQGASYDSLGTKLFSWTPSYFQAGKHVIHFMAWDHKGGFDDQPVTITVENVNRIPQITYYEPISTQLVGHKEVGEIFRFLVQVNDPDNDELTYEWYDNGILVSVKNSYDFYVADENLGWHTIKVKVRDGYDTAERTWELSVKVPVQLSHFSGQIIARKGIELDWETTLEVAHAGFNLLRKSTSDADYQQVNKQMIRSDGTKKYSFIDRDITVGETYSYKLEDVSISGEKTQHDPITVFVARPKDYKLYQNYPNPFNPTTHIEYQLPERVMVTIKIYNIRGQVVKTVVDDVKASGYHTAIWNGLDDNSVPVASGIYYYRMTTGTYVEVKKMVMLK